MAAEQCIAVLKVKGCCPWPFLLRQTRGRLGWGLISGCRGAFSLGAPCSWVGGRSRACDARHGHECVQRSATTRRDPPLLIVGAASKSSMGKMGGYWASAGFYGDAKRLTRRIDRRPMGANDVGRHVMTRSPSWCSASCRADCTDRILQGAFPSFFIIRTNQAPLALCANSCVSIP